MRLRTVFTLSAVALCLAATFGCQAKPATQSPTLTPPAASNERITRVYDIRELLIEIPNFDDEPNFSRREAEQAGLTQTPTDLKESQRGSLFGNAYPDKELGSPKSEDPAKALVGWIETNVTPAAWTSGAGIRESQGRLIVTAPPPTHRDLAALLADAHRRRSVQVMLEIRVLDPRDLPLDHLEPSLDAKLRIALSPIAPRNGFELTDSEADSLVRGLDSGPRSTMVGPPRITLFNGQHAYVLVAQQRACVRDYQAKAGGGYTPQVNVVEFGTLISARVGVSEDFKQVAMDLHVEFAELLGISKLPYNGAPAGEKLMIDEPEVRVRELRAITSVSSGKTLLFRGLRDVSLQLGWGVPASAASQPAMNGDRGGKSKPLSDDVIVLIKPVVIVDKN